MDVLFTWEIKEKSSFKILKLKLQAEGKQKLADYPSPVKFTSAKAHNKIFLSSLVEFLFLYTLGNPVIQQICIEYIVLGCVRSFNYKNK